MLNRKVQDLTVRDQLVMSAAFLALYGGVVGAFYGLAAVRNRFETHRSLQHMKNTKKVK